MTGTVADRTRWTDWLKQRWPTALAIASAVLILRDVASEGSNEAVGGLGEVLLLLPLLYLVIAKLQRRRASWLVLGVLLAALVALQVLAVVAPAAVFVAVALIILIWGAVDGQLHQPGQSTAMFRLQALGMIGFGALALLGLAVDPDLGRYLVAAGWFLHGIWDFVHLRLDKVVARSYAEACGVLDILVAAGLVFLT
jgi:hypothetical protein